MKGWKRSPRLTDFAIFKPFSIVNTGSLKDPIDDRLAPSEVLLSYLLTKVGLNSARAPPQAGPFWGLTS